MQDDNYRDRIIAFHFAGHAGSGTLQFVDREQGKLSADGERLAQLLGSREQIKLAFLNGCATLPLVAAFLEAGIQQVIATNRSVEDNQAANFGVTFYKEIVANTNLKAAFDFAANSEVIKAGAHDIRVRDNVPLKGEVNDTTLPWGLYSAQGKDASAVFFQKPVDPSSTILKSKFSKIIGALIVIIGALAGIAEFTGFSLRDLFASKQTGSIPSNSITVLVRGEKGMNDLVLPERGVVTLIYGDAIIPRTINDVGEIVFKQIPGSFFEPGAEVEILFSDPEKDPYRAKFQDSLYQLKHGEKIHLTAILEGMDKVNGFVVDFISEKPIENAIIRAAGVEATSNAFGEFELEFPKEKQQKFITVKAYKDGYKVYTQENIPTSTQEAMTIMMRPENYKK